MYIEDTLEEGFLFPGGFDAEYSQDGIEIVTLWDEQGQEVQPTPEQEAEIQKYMERCLPGLQGLVGEYIQVAQNDW